MSFAAILFTHYGLKIHSVLTKSLLGVYNVHDMKDIKKQKSVIQRLTIISISLCVFFIFQSIIAGFGILSQITSIHIDFVLVLLNLYLNLMYLIVFLFLYVPIFIFYIVFLFLFLNYNLSIITNSSISIINSIAININSNSRFNII